MNTPRNAAPQARIPTSAAWRAYLHDLQRFGIKLGLGNMRILLDTLGDPHLAFSTIHVAGTNGKGSVCAMLAEILSRAGLRVGLYTSPHLVRLEERIRVDGRLIPERDLRRHIGTLKSKIEKLRTAKTLEASPTFFEVLTAAAMLHFCEKHVDCAVLEVGMGGRFDATNVVIPLVSVITTVSKDHMEYLGNSLAKIAFEKAGIIKPGIPVVCGVSRGPALAVIRRRAREEKAPLIEVFGRGASFEPRRQGRRPSFDYRTGDDVYHLSPGLPGEHQGRNAAVAAAAARVLDRSWRPVGAKAIEDGIRTTRWEGRLERIGRRPRVYLDGAHNEAGAAAVAAFIEKTCPRPPVLVFAIMKDKAVGRVARILFPRVRKIILTTIPYKRAAAPAEIRAKAPEFAAKIILEPDLRRALSLARRIAGPAGTVVVTGSLFLVGEVKKIRPSA
ncbi:MAG: bifunctional folylpolyglutamate synthase/dihydrofolate synthase [Candidatus Aminicenantes bacterium]|nr:bifunctional folylpolyglutamate synthase/dihydrofolate synthase [Candidatus Aminicenantes bacterium]